jgi:hypothetical protein
MPIEPKNTPDYTNEAYSRMAPAWSFLSDMLAGQDTVKAAKETYLPKEVAELEEDYKARLARSLFPEDYRDCVVNLSAMPFRKAPTLADDVPDLIRTLAENIDNAGTHLDVFLQRLFQDSFFGHAFVVVDMPASSEDVRTAADEGDRRSYWCLRQAKDALNWRTTVVNGKTILSQITFKECTAEPDGEFGEKKVTRYRVYRLNDQGNAEWQLWEESDKADASGKKEVVMLGTAEIKTKRGLPLRRLPIAVHYGEYEGFLESRPPLKGIADINLVYYQKYSDLTNIEHHTCAVTLCITGVDPNQTGDQTVGGNRVLYLGVGAEAEFLTVEGKSIEHLEKDLQMLERRLVAKGLDFLQDDHYVPPTATEVVLSYTQRTSKLMRMVRSLEDCTETALSITAEMEGLDQGGSITIGVDESSLTLSAEQIRILSEMNERGQLSLHTLWGILDRADQLPDGFDEKDEEARLKAAALFQMELNAKQFDAGVESTP